MNYEHYQSVLSDDHYAMFLLHGVIDENRHPVRNYNRKHILKDEFARFLAALEDAGGHALCLSELAERKAAGEALPPRSFVLTFDDGFENNYSVAAPVLEDFNIPATIYVTSGFVEHNRMSWIDQIDYAIENTNKTEIVLPIFTEPVSVATPTDKITCLNMIRARVKADKTLFLGAEMLIEQVCEAAGVERVQSTQDQIDLKMTWPQVSEISAHPLFTIGGHTHTHPIMSYLSAQDLEYEITTCLRLIEESGAGKTQHFSYPEGLGHCYNADVISALKAKGIVCCPTAIDGVNTGDTDLFHIKRVMVV